jgi:transcription initiation factor TFIID subunit 13
MEGKRKRVFTNERMRVLPRVCAPSYAFCLAPASLLRAASRPRPPSCALQGCSPALERALALLRARSLAVGSMVYGFGGDVSPDPQTVDVLEDVMIDFVSGIVQRARAAATKPGKLRAQDLLYTIRKNPQQWGRAKELLLLKKEIEEAKKNSDVNANAVDTLEAYTVETGLPDAPEQRSADDIDAQLHSGDEAAGQ